MAMAHRWQCRYMYISYSLKGTDNASIRWLNYEEKYQVFNRALIQGSVSGVPLLFAKKSLKLTVNLNVKRPAPPLSPDPASALLTVPFSGNKACTVMMKPKHSHWSNN
jgi:hypothetical protein